MNFSTGLAITKLFNTLFELVKAYTKNMVYWHGAKRITSTKYKQSLNFANVGKKKKLQSKDELLLVLIRLHLGPLNEDLVVRFCISPTHCSNIQNVDTTS